MNCPVVLSCAMTLVICVTSAGVAQTLPSKDDPLAANAALCYWRAFAVLPKLEENHEKALNAALKLEPVNDELGIVVLMSEPALRELHRAASQPRCVWGTPFEDGFAVLLPHLDKARPLVRLALARAHWSFYRGKPADGVDDLIDAMVLARNVAADFTIIALLVDYSIEGMVESAAVADMNRMRPEELGGLAERLDRLPPAVTARQVILAERDLCFDPLIRDLATPAGRAKVLTAFDVARDPSLKAIMDLSSEQLLEGAIRVRPLYEKLAASCELPPSEVDKAFKELLADSNMKGPAQTLARMLVPAIVPVTQAEVGAKLRLALFKAVIAARRQGPEILADAVYHDPFAKAPFVYEETGSGFCLRTKTPNPRTGRPITLELGKGLSE